MFVATLLPAKVGDLIEMYFSMPGLNSECSVVCRVRWVRSPSPSDGDLAPAQRLQLLVGPQLAQGQMHAGKAPPKPPDEIHDQEVQRDRDEAQRQLPRLGPRDPLEEVTGQIDPIDNAARLREQRFPGRGQLHRALRAIEEPHL